MYAKTSVGTAQVLSTLQLTVLLTSKAAHTSTPTTRGIMEVSHSSEKWVRADVLVWDTVTSDSTCSFHFNIVIHHLRPTIGDAGPGLKGCNNSQDVQTRTGELGTLS